MPTCEQCGASVCHLELYKRKNRCEMCIRGLFCAWLSTYKQWKDRELTEVEKQAILADYQSGKSGLVIAKERGIPQGRVYTVLHASSGVTMKRGPKKESQRGQSRLENLLPADEIIARYQAGEKVPELAESFETTKPKVYALLGAAGVTRKRRSIRTTAHLDPAIVADYAAGMSTRKAGKKHGVSHEHVSRVVHAAGVARSQSDVFTLKRKLRPVKPDKLISVRSYLTHVIPKEWWELAYHQPDGPSVYMIADWLGEVTGQQVHAALVYHNVRTRTQKEAWQVAIAAGRVRRGHKGRGSSQS